MAFNREDLITWNELAPSFQTIIRALQTEITHLTQRLNTMRIVEKMVHFWYVYQQHKYSDHPHPNGLNGILRQPNTHYKVGDIVYDMELPPNCYLECISAGFTAPYIPVDSYNSYISDEEYAKYNTLDKINVEIARFYNVLEEHKLSTVCHPYASDFFIRQKNKAYAVGESVFDDTAKDVTRRLEVFKAGTTAPSDNTPVIPDPVLPSDLMAADEEMERLNNELENHINSSNPHASLTFMTRQPNTVYSVGNKVFIPGKTAQYYLECKSVSGTGKTAKTALSIDLP